MFIYNYTSREASLSDSQRLHWISINPSFMERITLRIYSLTSRLNVLRIARSQLHCLRLFLLHEALERIFKIFVFSMFFSNVCKWWWYSGQASLLRSDRVTGGCIYRCVKLLGDILSIRRKKCCQFFLCPKLILLNKFISIA